MRKLLTIATISLMTVGMALPVMARHVVREQGEDWYQQRLDVRVQQRKAELSAIQTSRQAEAQFSAIGDESTPAAMAANEGAALNVYDLTIESQTRANIAAKAALRF